MKVAVLSLTRNRSDYTRHCFASLREFAGISFDHYVLDQGSTDGTVEWLDAEHRAGRLRGCWLLGENIGIHRGMNKLIRGLAAFERDPYDVIVKIDNDCEFTTPGTLRAVCEVHLADPRSMVGPVVHGLRGPMPIVSERPVNVEPGGMSGWRTYRIGVTPMVGGILQPIPPGWRYDETQPLWGGDDDALSAQAVWCGQLLDFPVTHYETTDGQHARYPEYFAERMAIGGPA